MRITSRLACISDFTTMCETGESFEFRFTKEYTEKPLKKRE